jgi:hypothetical protein
MNIKIGQMETLLLLTATFLATSAMTAFSYMVSESFRDLYKEPVLLEYVMSGLKLKLRNTQKAILGWCIHYLIGLLFVLGYFILMWLGYIEINWLSGLAFGIIIGIIGILGWKIMFGVSGRMPIVSPSLYYLQLFFAHIIFAFTTVAAYYIFNVV